MPPKQAGPNSRRKPLRMDLHAQAQNVTSAATPASSASPKSQQRSQSVVAPVEARHTLAGDHGSLGSTDYPATQDQTKFNEIRPTPKTLRRPTQAGPKANGPQKPETSKKSNAQTAGEAGLQQSASQAMNSQSNVQPSSHSLEQTAAQSVSQPGDQALQRPATQHPQGMPAGQPYPAQPGWGYYGHHGCYPGFPAPPYGVPVPSGPASAAPPLMLPPEAQGQPGIPPQGGWVFMPPGAAPQQWPYLGYGYSHIPQPLSTPTHIIPTGSQPQQDPTAQHQPTGQQQSTLEHENSPSPANQELHLNGSSGGNPPPPPPARYEKDQSTGAALLTALRAGVPTAPPQQDSVGVSQQPVPAIGKVPAGGRGDSLAHGRGGPPVRGGAMAARGRGREWREKGYVASNLNQPPAIPPARVRPAHATADKIFAALRAEYPQLLDPLLLVLGLAIMRTDPKPPHSLRALEKVATRPQEGIPFAWILEATKQLEARESWIATVVTETLLDLNQAYLRGERLVLPEAPLLFSSPVHLERSLQLPTCEELEQAVQAFLADPSIAKARTLEGQVVPTRATMRIGHCTTIPEAAAEVLEKGGLGRLHAAALKDLPSLLAEKDGVFVSSDVDFGVKEISTQPSLSAYSGYNTANTLPELMSSIQKPHELWADDNQPDKPGGLCGAQRLYFREIVATAMPSQAPILSEIVLLDVQAVPARPFTFALVDDYGLCHPGSEQPFVGGTGVRLGPGESYPITVVMDTADGHFRRSESGVMQQLVLFTLLIPNCSAAPSPSCKLLADGKTAIVIIGCRVSVGLTRRKDEMQRMLNFEAKPFIAEHLRSLFNTMPAKYYAEPPPIKIMFDARELANSVCWWQKKVSKGLANPPAAYAHMGAVWDLRPKQPAAVKGPASPLAAQLEGQVRQFQRLLRLEEAAMEDHIRRHDLFNIRVSFAIFEREGRRSFYKLYAKLPAADADFDNERFQSLKRIAYRGPQLARLIPTPNLHEYGMERRALLTIDIPGLPEGRPAVVFGDTVYVRWAEHPQVEFAGSVIATDSTRCLVHMPSAFWLCCGSPPRSTQDLQRLQRVLGASQNAVKSQSPGLVHVRFSFDRTPMQRMHAALLAAGTCQSFQMLPPPIPEKDPRKTSAPGTVSLPSTEEFREFLAVVKAEAQVRPAARPPTGVAVRRSAEAITEVGGRELNAEQRWAVACMLEGAGRGTPFTLFGPPGTGKTVTLVECALQILKLQPEARLLLCAPQNYSADLLASALGDAGVTRDNMLRLVDPRVPPAQMKADVLQNFSAIDETLGAFELPPPEEVAAKRVVVTTCGAAGILREGAYKRLHDASRAASRATSANMALSSLEFSHVLIDEAGQALLPEAVVPLTLLPASGGQALLCGDPKQLGPVVRSAAAAAGADGRTGLAVSLLERFMEYHEAFAPALRKQGLAPSTGEFRQLVRNYRSHSTLLHIPNKLFYRDTLVAAADQSLLLPPRWSELQAEEGDPPPGLHPPKGNAGGVTDPAKSIGEPADLQAHPVENGGQGENGESAAGSEQESWDEGEELEEVKLPSTLFFGVRGEQMREGEAPSYFNPQEASALVDLLEGLLNQPRPGSSGVSVSDIGVIATYRMQVQKIRLLLRARGLGAVRVGTVDDFQGQEARIMFISTVLSRPESLPAANGAKDDDPHLGFFSNPKRFNVAITRAKALLVVLGHPVVLMEDPSWRELLRFCASRGAYRGAGSEAIKQLVRSDGMSSAHYPGLSDAFAEEQPGEVDDEEMAAAVSQIAELALLGVGHVQTMFPETLDEAYASFGSDELQWRVVL